MIVYSASLFGKENIPYLDCMICGEHSESYISLTPHGFINGSKLVCKPCIEKALALFEGEK